MEELLTNIRTFWKSAELVYDSGDYISASTLYFKCLFVLLDPIILKSKHITPKDHADRFRILQKDFPELYPVLDRIFPIYRDTYSLQVEKNKCNEVLSIAKEQGINISNS